jgi:succinate dehydrogenase/fumarate reductase flavoprotein subunit
MNRPAIDLYLNHKIDIEKEPVEISVCAQHNNGGLKANIWWESDLKHLFPIGEANGSHGVYRPGGSSLNSGQVGSNRAALFIKRHYSQEPPEIDIFLSMVKKHAEIKLGLATQFLNSKKARSNKELLKNIQHRMSSFGGIIRSRSEIEIAVQQAKKELEQLNKNISATNINDLADSFLLMDLCLTHYLYLEAIKAYIEDGGRSRGSFLVTDERGHHPEGITEHYWNYTICRYDREIENHILEIRYQNKIVEKKKTKVRPVPDQELWFEKVWKKNLEDNLTDC